MRYPVAWPVSVALDKAGFQDSYREVHPDPVEVPGITWPAARPFVPGYNPALDEHPADRIDFVYAPGPATTLESALVAERRAPDAEFSVAPWPTDHRAVLLTFEVVPAAPPPLIAVEQRLVVLGDEVPVRFHPPEEGAARVVITQRGDHPDASVAERVVSDGPTVPRVLVFPSRGWEPGPYDAVMIDDEGGERSRISFWVLDEATDPRVRTGKAVYDKGDAVRLRWQAAPGNRWDWIGVYRRGADPNVASYLLWLNTDASIGSGRHRRECQRSPAATPRPLQRLSARGRQLQEARRRALHGALRHARGYAGGPNAGAGDERGRSHGRCEADTGRVPAGLRLSLRRRGERRDRLLQQGIRSQ